MFGVMTRGAFSVLASSSLLAKAASRYGMRHGTGMARRFVAGEHSGDAIAASKILEQRGLAVTLDLLGERVSSSDAALSATRAYVELVQATTEAGISRSVSVKLTQIGLDIDIATTIDNLRRILEAGREPGFFVRVDMEGSAHTDATFDAINTLWSIGYRNVGVAVQAALRRSVGDIARLNEMGMSVRLVKGAYQEPRRIAFTRKDDVDGQFGALMEQLLTHGHQPAIATHDPALIDRTCAFASSRGIGPDAYEFEFLYGIRRDLQQSLVRRGHRVRIYVPYGREWFPYFMRRLGERPANVWFLLRSLVSEERTS